MSDLVKEYQLGESTWTYKGFHGVLHTFFPVGQTGAAMRSFFGDGTTLVLFFVVDDYVHWYWNDADLTRIREAFFTRLAEDPHYLAKLEKEWEGKIAAFNEVCKRIDDADFPALSDEALARLYEAFYAAYLEQFAYFMALGDAVSMHADRYVVPEFEALLGADFASAFPKLVTTQYLSFVEEEALAREKFADALRTGGTLDQEALEAHAREFFYIHNNYAKGVRLSAADFERMVREDVLKGGEPAHDARAERLAERDALIGKYPLTERHTTLLRVLDEFFKFQDIRKKNVLVANCYQLEFLAEAERRTGIPAERLRYSVFPEFRSVLDKSVDTDLLARRKEGVAALFPGSDYRLIEGAPAREALAFMQSGGKESTELKGMVASKGKATGRVKKILKIHDMANMEKGDVLVSSMTRPEMVPAMKLASAIVTDEGGITSHAAIVSRELRIPCVIGTKKATQLLSDGDMVEVDAEKGIVRKI